MWNIQYGAANNPQPYKDWPNIDIEPLAQIFQIRSAPVQKKIHKDLNYVLWLSAVNKQKGIKIPNPERQVQKGL